MINDVICAEAPGKCPHIKTDAVVVDVMSVVRRFTAKELVGVKTLGDLCEILLKVTVRGYGAQSNKVILVFENYKQDSPKAAERLRRMATDKVGRVYSVLSENQSMPDMEEFWSVQENKSSFQDFFARYCIGNYKETGELILAGGLLSDPEKCTVISNGAMDKLVTWRASHEEADDRIMHVIQQLHQENPGQSTVTVVTIDADIFVVLLYHLKNSWDGMKLYLLKKGNVKDSRSARQELHPLHLLLLTKMNPHVVDCLPAGHSLTGCDTVAKVGTKKRLLKTLELIHRLISDFGKDTLDDETIRNAEKFVQTVCLKSEEEITSFTDLRKDRYLHYHSTNKGFADLPCTSGELHQNIRWIILPIFNYFGTCVLATVLQQ